MTAQIHEGTTVVLRDGRIGVVSREPSVSCAESPTWILLRVQSAGTIWVERDQITEVSNSRTSDGP